MKMANNNSGNNSNNPNNPTPSPTPSSPPAGPAPFRRKESNEKRKIYGIDKNGRYNKN